MVDKKEALDKKVALSEVESVVKQTIAEKDQAQRKEEDKKKLEEFVQNITKKVEVLEQADAEKQDVIDALNNAISAKEEDLEKAEEEIKNLKSQLENTSKKLEEAEKEIAVRAEQDLANSRAEELMSKGLLLSSEEGQVAQLKKVMSMNEEEFNEYVNDLSDIRKQALASVSVIETEKEEKVKVEEEIAETVAREVKKESEEDISEITDMVRSVLARVKKTETAKEKTGSSKLEGKVPVNMEIASKRAAVITEQSNNKVAEFSKGLVELIRN